MNSRRLAVTAVLILVIAAIGVGAGGFVGPVQAATLVVDDDGADCPGAGHATIQSAVDGASGGDTIQVCSGTYNEKVTVEATNLFIVANGSVVMEGDTIESSAFVVNADGVVIAGFEMRNYTGSVVFTRANGGTISNNRIEFSMPGADTGTKGVYLYGARDTVITNNTIIDVPGGPSTRGPGILARGDVGSIKNTVIVNNDISAKRNGIDFRTDGSGSVIRNNSIYVDKVTLDGHSGIRLFDVRNVVVRRNDISVRQTGEGRGITGNVRSEGNLLIDNNTVTGARYGIWISGSSTPDKPVVVQSNNVSNSGNHGIRVKDVDNTRLVNNTVMNPGGHGMVLVDSDGFEVSGNWITGADWGLYLENSQGSTIAGNQLEETADDGIRVIGVDDTDVSVNSITNAGDDGVVVAESNGITATDNEITNPTDDGMVLHRNGENLTATGNLITGATNGIRLRNAGGALISGNQIRDSGIGLWFEPGNTLIEASSNVVSNTTTGIRVQASGSPGLADSRLRDNVVSNASSGAVLSNFSSEVVLWAGTTPNTTVENLVIDSATVSFEAQNVRLGTVDSFPADPDNRWNVSAYVSASPIDGDPSPWLDINVSYTDAAAVGLNESTLELWRYNGTAWSSVHGSTVDTAANRATANLTSFSVFALLAEPDLQPVCSGCSFPTDPDRDGYFEDVNGNDRQDFDDIVIFFNHIEDPAVTEHGSAYDFNGNDRIDFDDIVTLFAEF